ncbi:MAG TPA: YggT family protein [Candidatus Limnocylindrales bacterium]
MGFFLGNLIELALLALTLLVLGRVLLSWVDPRGRSSLAIFVFRTTEPILGPVRRALPSTGAIDLSPMIVLIALAVLLRLT